MRQLRPQYCSRFLASSRRATFARAAAMSASQAGAGGQEQATAGEQQQPQPHHKLPKVG
jgi:hypothetical protein